MGKEEKLNKIEKRRLESLDNLAAQINDEHRYCESALKSSLDHALKVGKLLVEAKSRCPHGAWEAWLEQNFDGSLQVAQAYMRMAQGGEEAQVKSGPRQGWHQAKHRTHGTLAPLVTHVLRLQFRSIVIWGVALGLLSALTVVSFPPFSEGNQLNEMLQNYPPEMRELFGIKEGTDLFTIEGFLASQLFSFLVPLALAFFPILASAAAIAGAEERGTIDVLLSNPVPRWQLVVGSLVATAVSLLGIVAILGLFTWVPALLLDVDLSLRKTAEAMLNLWPLCLFFGGLAMLCSAVFHRRALAIAIPGAVLVGMYFLNALGNLVEEIEDLQPLSVFYHYGSAIEEGIDWANFGGVTLATLLLVLLAVLAFARRDIYT
jgi:ABC-2 type transport system permease protein